MAIPVYVAVRSPEGRRTPIDRQDGIAPGGGVLYAPTDESVKVRWSQTTRRSVNRGDLVLVDAAGKAIENQLDPSAAAWQEPAPAPTPAPAKAVVASKGGAS